MRAAGIHVCCGGIVGMGETREDRVGMIATLANLPVHPEIGADQHAGAGRRHAACGQRRRSTRSNSCAPSPSPASPCRNRWCGCRPAAKTMSEETQALCFLAGANSIFCGPKLLTTPNPERARDQGMMGRLGMSPM